MTAAFRCAAVSDVHGNAVALDAVLDDAGREGVDEVWALGDLVALGPDPVGVLERLAALPATRVLAGNTDRYVATGDRPRPTLEDAGTDPARLAIVVAMEARFSWTAGVVTAAGWLDWLDALPMSFRADLPDGTSVLAVHAEPGADDGAGIGAHRTDDDLRAIAEAAAADVVLAGHTHVPFDRTVDGTRLVNLGSVSNPGPPDLRASYALLTAGPTGTTIEHRRVAYDVDAVIARLERVRHPFREYLVDHFRGRVAHTGPR